MKKTIFIIALLLSFNSAFSQLKKGDELDKIVAIVGKEIIMKSDIDGRIIMMAQQNSAYNPNDPKLREEVLNNILEEKLLITKAIEDSIIVSDDEINQRWEVFLQTSIRRYGSEDRLSSIYGMSIPRLKIELTPEIKNQLLSSKLVERKFSNLTVSQKEVVDFYEEYKDSLPNVPPSVELYHIVKNVAASNEASDEVYNLALRVRDSLLKDSDFAEMAKKYSGDYASASDGGNLGWFDKGKLFPEFETAAFKLQPGEISMPVKTPFGYHLIETLEKKENSINTRHILFKVGQSTDDRDLAKAKLNEIRDSIISGGYEFEKFALRYSDDKETRGFGGLIGKVGLNELPGDLAQTVESLEDGEISEPLPYSNDPVNPKYHIIYRKRLIPSHKPTLEDDYDFISERAKFNKRIDMYDEWIAELKEELYWEKID
jgi:peptidyl-prolyl cis-trans isomerase SurA